MEIMSTVEMKVDQRYRLCTYKLSGRPDREISGARSWCTHQEHLGFVCHDVEPNFSLPGLTQSNSILSYMTNFYSWFRYDFETSAAFENNLLIFIHYKLNADKCNLVELTTKSTVVRSCGQRTYALCRRIGFVSTCYHRWRDLPAILPSWSLVVFVFTPIPPSLSFSTDSSVWRVPGFLGMGAHGWVAWLFQPCGAILSRTSCAISGSPWISQAPTFHNKRCSC